MTDAANTILLGIGGVTAATAVNLASMIADAATPTTFEMVERTGSLGILGGLLLILLRSYVKLSESKDDAISKLADALSDLKEAINELRRNDTDPHR